MHIMMREWEEEGVHEEALFLGTKPVLDAVAALLNASPNRFYTYIPRPITEITLKDVLNLEQFLKRENINLPT